MIYYRTSRDLQNVFLSIIRDNSIEELFSTKYIIDLSDERLSDNYFDWFWFYWNQNKDNSLSINFTNSFYYIEFVINWYIYYQIRKDHWEKIDDIDIFCNHKSFPDVITDYFEKKYYKLVGIYILLHKNFLISHSYLPFHIVDFDKINNSFNNFYLNKATKIDESPCERCGCSSEYCVSNKIVLDRICFCDSCSSLGCYNLKTITEKRPTQTLQTPSIKLEDFTKCKNTLKLLRQNAVKISDVLNLIKEYKEFKKLQMIYCYKNNDQNQYYN